MDEDKKRRLQELANNQNTNTASTVNESTVDVDSEEYQEFLNKRQQEQAERQQYQSYQQFQQFQQRPPIRKDQNKNMNDRKNKSGKLSVWKLVSGILSIMVFILTEFWSCLFMTAEIAGAEDYGLAYMYGFVSGALMLTAGIVSIVLQHSDRIGPDIAISILYILSVLFDLLAVNDSLVFNLLIFLGIWSLGCTGLALTSMTLKCIRSNLRIVIIVCLMLLTIIGSIGLIAFENWKVVNQNEKGTVKIALADCIDDELGWLTNESAVIQSMQTFCNVTDVQPYLIVTDNIDGKNDDLTDDEVSDYLNKVYEQEFNDENHMILLFIEYESGEYGRYIYTGKEASTVITSNATDYGIQLLDLYYTDKSLSDDEFFESFFETWAEYFE